MAILLTTCAGHPTFAPDDPTPIRHTVFIIKENRTFDTYFGGFSRADGATSAMTSAGQLVESPTLMKLSCATAGTALSSQWTTLE